MARFSKDEAVAVAEIQQLINDWVFELDFHHGVNMDELVTNDCSYTMISGAQIGKQAIVEKYRHRVAHHAEQGEEPPAMRHLNANLRVSFLTPDKATITFGLLYFTAEGHPAGMRHTDAAAVADVYMDCRRESDGHWRISRFESGQPFSRSFA